MSNKLLSKLRGTFVLCTREKNKLLVVSDKIIMTRFLGYVQEMLIKDKRFIKTIDLHCNRSTMTSYSIRKTSTRMEGKGRTYFLLVLQFTMTFIQIWHKFLQVFHNHTFRLFFKHLCKFRA